MFEEVNFLIEQELQISFNKIFDIEYHIKGYHAYMNEWTPEIGEILKTRLNSKFSLKMLSTDLRWQRKKRVNSLTSKQTKFRTFCKKYIIFPTCNPWKYMSSWSLSGKGQLRQCAKAASTMYSSQEKTSV